MRRAILKLGIGLVCGAGMVAAQARRPLTAGRHAAPKSRVAAPANPAQAAPVFDASELGSTALLDKGWRVGISSDPAVAQPDFDDSAWAVRDATESMESVKEPGDTGGPPRRIGPPRRPGGGMGGEPGPEGRRFAWFRLHIKLPPHHGPLALLIELPVSQNTSLNLSSTGWGVDVFANGREIQPEGPHAENPRHYQQISRIYDLGVKPNDTSLVLVLRTLYIPLGFDSYTNFFAGRTLWLGYRADLENALSMWSARKLFERLPRLVVAILLLILAFFLLVLYYTQRDHPEYLWLALHELMQAPIGFVELAGSSAYLDTLWYGAIVLQLVLVSAYLYFEFLVAFLSLRRRWYSQGLRYTAPILAFQGPLLLMVGHRTGIGVALAFVSLGCIVWIIGWFLFIFITLIAATVKKNYEAGLLLLALVLTMVGMAEPMVTMSASEWLGRQIHSPLTLQAGPIPIQFAAVADFIGIVVIVVIIFMRFLRIQADQEHSKSEMAAARSVQELMIPQQRVETPGFEVDSAYVPAQEVGGDFFHVQATDDGGLLVVIGDVAGKGLTAAMNVSMLMGALRQSRERSPARILETLNRVLVGSESFTTCQAAWFGADGELTVANAGHLPPYLNSQEVAIPGGLPLGVLQEGEYPETRLYLHPGDRILMCSDGVVEARGPAGELFGFERVHNLSNQSAFYMAEAAKDFGQEDDITVLTVKRAPVAVAVPAMAGK
ncbi:MAG TPA: PP2C family protein-serine/threonine phosphatase [Terracidiphilus sp.]|nr:PP2C family protein-serine/threonine phosphatase [Terracidiphilus sp.]